MQLPQWLARVNRYVTNPIQRIWAGYAPTFGILEHVGRKSGRVYRTPLTVFSTADGVAIMLTYGPDRDWLKNITAAGLRAVAVRQRCGSVAPGVISDSYGPQCCRQAGQKVCRRESPYLSGGFDRVQARQEQQHQ